MANKDSKGNWFNKNNKEVDPRTIRPDVKKRDRMVCDITAEVLKLQDKMKKTKIKIMGKINKHIAYKAKDKKFNLDKIDGNIQFSNYDNTLQVDINRGDIIFFDDNLKYAKEKMDRCIKKWNEGSRPEIKSLVQRAFNVDKSGRVNRALILDLKNIYSTDALWNEAIQLINDSVQVREKRTYIQFKSRANPKDKFTNINLNFSNL
jgi:hypothetical protein